MMIIIMIQKNIFNPETGEKLKKPDVVFDPETGEIITPLNETSYFEEDKVHRKTAC